MSQVEYPSGDQAAHNEYSISDLKRAVAARLGVDARHVTILDSSTNKPLRDSDATPLRTKVVPKPEWGFRDGG